MREPNLIQGEFAYFIEYSMFGDFRGFEIRLV
jgi:hypothetical protein